MNNKGAKRNLFIFKYIHTFIFIQNFIQIKI